MNRQTYNTCYIVVLGSRFRLNFNRHVTIFVQTYRTKRSFRFLKLIYNEFIFSSQRIHYKFNVLVTFCSEVCRACCALLSNGSSRSHNQSSTVDPRNVVFPEQMTVEKYCGQITAVFGNFGELRTFRRVILTSFLSAAFLPFRFLFLDPCFDISLTETVFTWNTLILDRLETNLNIPRPSMSIPHHK